MQAIIQIVIYRLSTTVFLFILFIYEVIRKVKAFQCYCISTAKLKIPCNNQLDTPEKDLGILPEKYLDFDGARPTLFPVISL